MNLLDTLISDEKKCDRKFYSAGPYWKHKNLKTVVEIKKMEYKILEEQIIV